MKRCWLLTCSNFRKAKGQAITIFVLVLLAAMLLNIWLILSFQYSKNFDARSELLNSEDVLFIYQSQDPAFIDPLQTVLAEDARTDMYTIENCLSLNLTCKYRDGDMNTYFVCYPADQAAERSLGQYRFLEKTENPAENTIYLPYLYQTGGGYQTGDPFEFSVQNTTYRFIVGGFFENMLAGSFNGGVCTMLMEQSAYDALAEEQSLASTSVSVKLKERADNAAYASQTGDKILQLYPQIGYNYTWYDMSKQARTMTANICSAIVSGVAFLIIIIALIVIAFNVSNGIDEGMQSLGALKAIGYKSRQLILSLLLQFLLAGCGGVLCGAALSYAVLPILNALLVAQTGIPWEVRFFGIPMALSLLMILLMIAAAVYLSARKIRKIAPIDMLRQGIRTHNFKRNPFPLSQTSCGLGTALSFKTMYRNAKQNIAICMIILVISLLAAFTGVMYQNFIVDPNPFLGLVAGEQADMGITVSGPGSKIYDTLQADGRIEKIYPYFSSAVYYDDGNVMCYVTDDCRDLNNPEICYAGRLPAYENELALGGMFAKEQNLKIGDLVTFRVADREAEYLICGLIQCSNYLGRDCMMTTAGFSKISDIQQPGYYMNVKDGVNIDTLITSLKQTYDADIVNTVNIRKVIQGSLGVYTELVGGVVAAIIVLSLIIITFVLYLMVKTLLIRKKRDYGIYKALGYTTRQLILQTAGSFMPVMAGAAASGMVVGVFAVNPLLTVFFQTIGVMKCTFAIPPLMIVLLGIFLVAFAFAISCLVSLKIRRITPRALMAGE